MLNGSEVQILELCAKMANLNAFKVKFWWISAEIYHGDSKSETAVNSTICLNVYQGYVDKNKHQWSSSRALSERKPRVAGGFPSQSVSNVYIYMAPFCNVLAYDLVILPISFKVFAVTLGQTTRPIANSDTASCFYPDGALFWK